MCAQLSQSWIIQLILLLNLSVFCVIFHQITLSNIHATYMSQLEDIVVTVQ